MNASQKTGKKTVTFLGNCVAERLLLMLHEYPGFSERYTLKRFRIIPHIQREHLEQVANLATQCDIIFTQPLFRYGPCNTAEIRKRLCSEQKLFVFSSPNFHAYFPDACTLRSVAELRSPRVMDWDSKIIFSCYMRGVPIDEVEEIYTSHWLFQKDHMKGQIEMSLGSYQNRDEGTDLSSYPYFIKNFMKTKLLHSPRHPVVSFLETMCEMLVDALGIQKITSMPESCVYDFSLNQWPIITRHHKYFSFAEQDYFVVSFKRFSIEDIATAYYYFYQCNPGIMEANRHYLIDLEESI